MKVIIAGSRYGVNQQFFDDCMKRFSTAYLISEIISGAAPGVDTQAIDYANAFNLPCIKFPADWKNLGRAAGPIRNEKMAQYADYLVAFFNKDHLNFGTKNMVSQMKKLNKPFLIFDERLFEDRSGKILENKIQTKNHTKHLSVQKTTPDSPSIA